MYWHEATNLALDQTNLIDAYSLLPSAYGQALLILTLDQTNLRHLLAPPLCKNATKLTLEPY